MSELSPLTIETVKATIPVLREYGDTITAKMYDILFENYPETKSMFSSAPDEQPKVLAGAVSAYAMNIDNLDALSDAVGKMASTHVRTSVKPEHYPMVGESLLAAMTEVLGDAATPEILDSWGEAFFFLGDILIAKEKELYAQT
ncbi:MAG: Flavohemoprotein (Hemoglobin-like protein) (Flavohemoglobin) (Nitric oxide dioxygenase) (EC [uncultured Thiotrichaceae bacterium]|uniref:Flavohemoprotein (Hemoglobin-like protein) (Flavohemoglobin) (Nitric oxide dioxygenase) (EC) n=1 Tax=uncultured Thiotrichaceae bacterium TaxID=298394 RepID=A0A6S6TK87_9GAMM|nr:MAG: Flavohemoprotein (Hemoglobin-like protein) (Flavohemoglobin) (Nitric oxide dioxygenase) (EC [uncultured Thiotrichaceae bacterium]